MTHGITTSSKDMNMFIGAVSGAAAGLGVAAATRKDDVVLDAGTPLLLMLTEPLVL